MAVFLFAFATSYASSQVPSKHWRVMTLPYQFARHGVDIQTNSVEFVEGQVLVNLTMQEKRGVPVALNSNTLMRVFSATGKALTYLHYSRDGQEREAPISLTPRQRAAVTLIFQPGSGPGPVDGPIEVHFPTGRYWSSQKTK